MTAFERRLLQTASDPYRKVSRYAWHFAQGKLKADPVFLVILRQGFIRPYSRVLDLGCGQGLVASLLIAAEQHTSDWPPEWAPAPVQCQVHGLELMAQDVSRAQSALRQHRDRLQFEQADMRYAVLPSADTVVMLDVLHYIDHASQEDLLKKVLRHLLPQGHLLLRVGDAAQNWRHQMSQWTDKLVCRFRGLPMPRLYCRSHAEWQVLLHTLGYSVESHPLNQGATFANVLLIAKPASASLLDSIPNRSTDNSSHITT